MPEGVSAKATAAPPGPRVVDVDQVLAVEDERLAAAELVMLAAQLVRNDRPAEVRAQWATAAGRAR